MTWTLGWLMAAAADAHPLDTEVLTGVLAPLCGELTAGASVDDRRQTLSSGKCIVELDDRRHLVHLRVDDDGRMATAHEPIGAEELASRAAADTEWLISLGFAAGELGEGTTKQIASESTEDGEATVVGYHETKTWVDRRLGGVIVVGERLVVTRTVAGDVIGLTGRWSPLAAGFALMGDDRSLTDAAAASAAGVQLEDVVGSRRIIVPTAADETGALTAGYFYTELYWREPEIGSKTRTSYLDGDLLVALDPWSAP